MTLFKKIKDWFGPHCTGVPDFDIGRICYFHDNDYDRARTISGKVHADNLFFKRIVSHGLKRKKIIRYFILACVYYTGVQLFGWTFFFLCKIKDEIKFKDKIKAIKQIFIK